MFCEAPFCDIPFTSFYEIFINGEIFYFDADIQQLVGFVFDIQQSEGFVVTIDQIDAFVIDIYQSGQFDMDLQLESLFTSTIIR